jgi:DNA-3-methyladenine glycosylase
MTGDKHTINSPHKIPKGFFERDVVSVAQQLIGASLFVDGVGGTIVETEAYRIDDAASHSFRGQTPRNSAMFGDPGHAYVYRSHGLHWCFNMVCMRGSAVLIRALEPQTGVEDMQRRRSLLNPRLLCAGPGRLCQALGIDLNLNAKPLEKQPFELRVNAEVEKIIGQRIGISRAIDLPWRFGLAGSLFLSRPFR